MRTLFIAGITLLLYGTPLCAQKEKPYWAAGLYGSISAGYGFFSQPLEKEDVVIPYNDITKTGSIFTATAGLESKTNFGVAVQIFLFNNNTLIAHSRQVLEKEYPGYFITYLPQYNASHKRVAGIFLGLSYIIPRNRWAFRPTVMIGGVPSDSYGPIYQVKQAGTHKAIQLSYPLEGAHNTALSTGGRVSWHAGWYFGFFGEAQFLTQWQRVHFNVAQYDAIAQSYTSQEISLKKVSWGAALNVGVFMQIARWEKGVTRF